MKLKMVGLGKMGLNLALNMKEDPPRMGECFCFVCGGV